MGAISTLNLVRTNYEIKLHVNPLTFGFCIMVVIGDHDPSDYSGMIGTTTQLELVQERMGAEKKEMNR